MELRFFKTRDRLIYGGKMNRVNFNIIKGFFDLPPSADSGLVFKCLGLVIDTDLHMYSYIDQIIFKIRGKILNDISYVHNLI
jgi:hypothetical protein